MAWTDDPLTTSIDVKTVHISELRTQIDYLNDTCAVYHTSHLATKDVTIDTTKYDTVYTNKDTTFDATKDTTIDSSDDYGYDSTYDNTENYGEDGGYDGGYNYPVYTNHCVGY